MYVPAKEGRLLWGAGGRWTVVCGQPAAACQLDAYHSPFIIQKSSTAVKLRWYVLQRMYRSLYNNDVAVRGVRV